MADFVEGFGSFKPSFPFMEMDSSFDLMNHFSELNATAMENPSLALLGYSNESFLPQQPDQYNQPPSPYVDNFSGFLPAPEYKNPIPVPPPSTASAGETMQGSKKRKTATAPDCASGSYSTPASESALGDEVKTTKKKSSGKGKRVESIKAKEMEKPKEVVHVRARRGQATDSHSLAERVRREKINERMRCLQDLVPGCYKAMGMAVMLDEIINYVQSLQNQVEFLSMKLSAASTFYDFNLDMDAAEMAQVVVGNGPYEGQEVDRLVREGGYGGCTTFHSTLPF